jgi:hypothetical protein
LLQVTQSHLVLLYEPKNSTVRELQKVLLQSIQLGTIERRLLLISYTDQQLVDSDSDDEEGYSEEGESEEDDSS